MIDGVMRSRTAAGFGDLGELSSIEVARGPQSVFYGSNTSAGLIYVSTKKPSKKFEANSFLTLGNLNYQNWGASINGPLSENLFGRLFFTTAQRDGYMIVNQGLANERHDNNINYYSSRGQLSVSYTHLDVYKRQVGILVSTYCGNLSFFTISTDDEISPKIMSWKLSFHI